MSDQPDIDVSPGTKVEKGGHRWVYCRKNFLSSDLPLQHMVVSTVDGSVQIIYPQMHGSVSKALRENGFSLPKATSPPS
jgi:hypothetical protein